MLFIIRVAIEYVSGVSSIPHVLISDETINIVIAAMYCGVQMLSF